MKKSLKNTLEKMERNNAVLMGYCIDQPGIARSITDFIYNSQGNIKSDQTKTILEYVKNTKKIKDSYFVFRYDLDFENIKKIRLDMNKNFEEVSKKFDMKYSLSFTDNVKNIALFVTKEQHCLKDVLSKVYQRKLNVKIPVIISNRQSSDGIDLKRLSKIYGFEYFYFPIDKSNKKQQEIKEAKIMKENNIDLIVLAKYRQILTKTFLDMFKNKVINVHDSRLPRYPGAFAHLQAYSAGAKSVGATTHFVSPELDQGPIIDEEWEKVSG